MKKIIAVLLLCVLFFGLGCEDLITLEVNCDECFFPEPDSADIVVYVSYDNDISQIPLVIYKGKADARNIEHIDTATSDTYYLSVKTNEYYSVEATYNVDGKTIIVGDGDKIRTRHVTDVCSDECYVIKDGIMNVRLKR